MTAKLTASLREAPTTVPALAALALFVVWATSQAGYPVTHWAPGALIVLALLGIALGLVRLRPGDVPVPVRIALGALAAYTALSYLSILWAAVPGEAWEGANRTLLYLAVFALFACWRQRGRSAALALGAWTLALIALAAFVALHVNAAGDARLQTMLPGGRLLYPSGYPNANAAQWLMAFWPARAARARAEPAVGPARPARRRRRAAGGGGAAQPEPRLAVRHARRARARVRAAARAHAHVRRARPRRGGQSPRRRRRCCGWAITSRTKPSCPPPCTARSRRCSWRRAS